MNPLKQSKEQYVKEAVARNLKELLGEDPEPYIRDPETYIRNSSIPNQIVYNSLVKGAEIAFERAQENEKNIQRLISEGVPEPIARLIAIEEWLGAVRPKIDKLKQSFDIS